MSNCRPGIQWRILEQFVLGGALGEQHSHAASPGLYLTQAVHVVAVSWLGQSGQVQTMESSPDDSLAWTHYRRIIHEHGPLRRADFQQSPALDNPPRSVEPPRRPAKSHRRRANESGDAGKGMFKSLKGKVDTCSNAIERDMQKTWATRDI